MQFLRTQFRTLLSKPNLLRPLSSDLHIQPCCQFKFQMLKSVGKFENNRPDFWLKKNELEFPIQDSSEEPRKGYVCHVKNDIPVSWKNLWYIAALVEGLSVDEALRQLSFVPKKGAYYAKEAIKEAVELGVREHNIEFKSNMWISKSFPMTEKLVFRGLQRKVRRGIIPLKTSRCYYYLRLEEGSPPSDFKKPPTGEAMLEAWFKKMRNRRITTSL